MVLDLGTNVLRYVVPELYKDHPKQITQVLKHEVHPLKPQLQLPIQKRKVLCIWLVWTLRVPYQES